MSEENEDIYDPDFVLEYDIKRLKERLAMYDEAIRSLERAVDESTTGKFIPIAAKPICERMGMLPTRIVLLQWTGANEGQWSTHWQVFPLDRKSYYGHGNYFTNEEHEKKFQSAGGLNMREDRSDCNCYYCRARKEKGESL